MKSHFLFVITVELEAIKAVYFLPPPQGCILYFSLFYLRSEKCTCLLCQ